MPGLSTSHRPGAMGDFQQGASCERFQGTTDELVALLYSGGSLGDLEGALRRDSLGLSGLGFRPNRSAPKLSEKRSRVCF